jgi:hypothetical protein
MEYEIIATWDELAFKKKRDKYKVKKKAASRIAHRFRLSNRDVLDMLKDEDIGKSSIQRKKRK